MTNDISEIIRNWPSDFPFSARTAASKCSQSVSSDQLFDLVIEECLDVIDRDGSVQLDSFLTRFPEIADRLLPAISMLPQASDSNWPRVGDSINELRIIQTLGVGGCSRVYLAEDGRSGGRATVLKITASPTDEAIYLARMNHTSVCTLYHSEMDSKLILLQYTAGPNGKSLLNSRRAKLAEIPPRYSTTNDYNLKIVLALGRIAAAIEHVHRRGVAHNDIKPENIVFGESETLLIDFDAASEIGVHGARRPIGTIDYLSNESLNELVSSGQLVGQNCVHDDKFAFTATCYEMLVGTLPWNRNYGDANPAAIRSLLEQRRRVSLDSVSCTEMPQALAQTFFKVFNSTTPPPCPLQLAKCICKYYCVPDDFLPPQLEPGLLLKDMNPATQLNFVRNKTLPEALFNQSRTTVGTAIASVLLFVLVIVISLPIGTQRGNQSSVEASFTPLSVSSASSHSTVANKHLVRMPHSQVETTFSPIEVMQKDATKNSEMSAEDAAHLAYMISSMSPNHERQVILYEIAISKGEADAAIWNNYGFSLVYVRRPEEARRAFIQSIQMNPKLLQPFFHLASLDGTCPGKFGAAPVGVSAFAALQRMPDEPIVRQLAVSALKALGAVDNGSVESQETANRLRVLLDGTRHLTLRQPISPYVVPYLCTQAEVVVDVKPIP